MKLGVMDESVSQDQINTAILFGVKELLARQALYLEIIRSKIFDLTKQIRDHHDCQTKIDITDAKYDNTDNYTLLREYGSIPISDYNVRRENPTAQALRERGYDRNGPS